MSIVFLDLRNVKYTYVCMYVKQDIIFISPSIIIYHKSVKNSSAIFKCSNCCLDARVAWQLSSHKTCLNKGYIR
jgi:hypothetical protein